MAHAKSSTVSDDISTAPSLTEQTAQPSSVQPIAQRGSPEPPAHTPAAGPIAQRASPEIVAQYSSAQAAQPKPTDPLICSAEGVQKQQEDDKRNSLSRRVVFIANNIYAYIHPSSKTMDAVPEDALGESSHQGQTQGPAGNPQATAPVSVKSPKEKFWKFFLRPSLRIGGIVVCWADFLSDIAYFIYMRQNFAILTPIIQFCIILYGILGIGFGFFTAPLLSILMWLDAGQWFREKLLVDYDGWCLCCLRNFCKRRYSMDLSAGTERTNSQKKKINPTKVAEDRENLWNAVFLVEDFIQTVLILIILVSSKECRLLADYLFTWWAVAKFSIFLVVSTLTVGGTIGCGNLSKPKAKPKSSTEQESGQELHPNKIETSRNGAPPVQPGSPLSPASHHVKWIRAHFWWIVKILSALCGVASIGIQAVFLAAAVGAVPWEVSKWVGPMTLDIEASVRVKIEYPTKHNFHVLDVPVSLFHGEISPALIRTGHVDMKVPCPLFLRDAGIVAVNSNYNLTVSLKFGKDENTVFFNLKLLTGKSDCHVITDKNLLWSDSLLNMTLHEMLGLYHAKVCLPIGTQVNSKIPRISCCGYYKNGTVDCNPKRFSDDDAENHLLHLRGSMVGCGDPNVKFDNTVLARLCAVS